MASFGPLVSTGWLADRLGETNLKIVDGSWRMPGDGAAVDDYNKRHIPGALFFDIDAVADQKSALPHMLPSSRDFEKAMGACGVSNADRIVVYDDQGVFSAARVWWTYRAMGHADVAVLDGGLRKWMSEDRPVTASPPIVSPTRYAASPIQELCRSANDVRAALFHKTAVVIDARPPARFSGAAPEPRGGLRSGHMPGAVNAPFAALLNEDGTMRTAEEIKNILSFAGADLSRPAITTCGSGVTAAIISLALEMIGHNRHSLYDGSWTEWGDETNDSAAFPVVAGEGS